MDYTELCKTADEARNNSYCVYSGFSVGAALLTPDGRVYTGCNIENAAYPAGICAERTAFCKAVSEGEREFRAIAVAGGRVGEAPDDAFPCGVCRQFMNEFVDSDSFEVIIVHRDLSYTTYRFGELLPYSFGSKKLQKEP